MKNRSKVAAQLDKLQHGQRQEAAQQRREEKKRAEKEKMLQESDPEKTRKWEVCPSCYTTVSEITVKPPDKGHSGDDINSYALSLVEKLSTF